MIEVVNKEYGDNKGQAITFPKNIRQIGEPSLEKKIYIEDYVITFLKDYTKEKKETTKVAILLGKLERAKGCTYMFIRSAIEVKAVTSIKEELYFTEEIWSEIYEKIEEYFTEQDILGWFVSNPTNERKVGGVLIKNHVSNFGGGDKILLRGDVSESEEEIYMYEHGTLERQRGYYIFYEKNKQMQRYMIDIKGGQSVDESEIFDDHAIQSFRSIIQEKKELSGQKRLITFLYTASTFLIVVVLSIGITMINSYEKMEELEVAIHTLSDSLEEIEPDVEIERKEIEEIKEETEVAKVVETETAMAEVETLKEYIVEKGDTLLKISKELYGTEEWINKICEINKIEDSDTIFEGEKLLLP